MRISARIEDVIPEMTAIADKSISIPATMDLDQNFPNPFNPKTSIVFRLPESQYIILSVYNNLGQKIKDLFAGNLSAGEHKVLFQADKLASGIYYYRLQGKNGFITKRMLIIE